MTVSQTLMMCLAVDMDLNNKRPEFGPVSFHEAMSTVKAHNKKSGGYVAKKGDDLEESFISGSSSSVVHDINAETPIDIGEDHENLFWD